MVDELRHLTHLYVVDRVRTEDFSRGGQGNPKIRPVEYRAHGAARKAELQGAFSDVDSERASGSLSVDELKALGSIITLEGENSSYPLKIDSLQSFSKHRKTPSVPRWLLLSVQPATDALPERAVVWVADAYRSQFLKIFEDYLDKKVTTAGSDRWETPEGNPANRALVANISNIRRAILDDLWQSGDQPVKTGIRWWELWLDPSEQQGGAIASFAASCGLKLLDRSLALNNRVVVWIRATWQQLEVLPFTSVPLAEIRRPEFIDSIEDLSLEEQGEYVEDLALRVVPAHSESPAVCHLDTGVARTHRLLQGSLGPRRPAHCCWDVWRRHAGPRDLDGWLGLVRLS